MKKKVFSGIQPSGQLHIGNYLGAIKNWIHLQNDYEAIFCIVDLHAITVPQDPEELKKRVLEIAKIYLASGINPEKSTIFVQSQIQEHTELAWILNTLAKISEMERMTQFKDKSQKKGQENSSVGLFDYPVLMASDILLYNTDLVPVGEDQLQHIELARTLARRFNKKFGNTFILPQPSLQKNGTRIMGLDNPLKKMSKSSSSEYNYISLLDSAEIVQKKIRKAVTDSGSKIVYSTEKPALKNLINIYSLFSEKTTQEIEIEYQDRGYAEFKNDLAQIIIEFLTDFQKKFQAISDEEVIKILKQGAQKAFPLAKEKMKEVKEKMGLSF